MFNNEPTRGAESDSKVPEGMRASSEQVSKGDTSGGHGLDGGSSERHFEDVSQTLGDEDLFSTLGVRQNAQLKYATVQSETSAAGEDKATKKAT
ncbi:hypothetical protein Acr_18g0010370 [Actinidia rufa]|uniref:Uncharacterized protein n=1 Tax=Actinidia rufa TaxID=165716 RepID=A0A7J0G7U5_9ERIC|nr:hypothetical protein Acr_18g0010370 [Actinidia rufa]